MKSFPRYLILSIAVCILTIITASSLGSWYHSVFPPIGGTSPVPREGADFLVGLFFAYTLLVPLLFIGFGGPKKHWVTGILLLPALAFELYFDPAHIYIPVILALLGWLIGYGILKIYLKSSVGGYFDD